MNGLIFGKSFIGTINTELQWLQCIKYIRIFEVKINLLVPSKEYYNCFLFVSI